MTAEQLTHHIPTVDLVYFRDGDNKHVQCRCGDMFAWEIDWAAHTIAEATR